MKCLIKKTHKVKYYFKYKNKYYGVGSKKCVKKLKEKIKNKDINVKKVKLNKSQRNNLINLNKKKSFKQKQNILKGGENNETFEYECIKLKKIFEWYFKNKKDIDKKYRNYTVEVNERNNPDYVSYSVAEKILKRELLMSVTIQESEFDKYLEVLVFLKDCFTKEIIQKFQKKDLNTIKKYFDGNFKKTNIFTKDFEGEFLQSLIKCFKTDIDDLGVELFGKIFTFSLIDDIHSKIYIEIQNVINDLINLINEEYTLNVTKKTIKGEKTITEIKDAQKIIPDLERSLKWIIRIYKYSNAQIKYPKPEFKKYISEYKFIIDKIKVDAPLFHKLYDFFNKNKNENQYKSFDDLLEYIASKGTDRDSLDLGSIGSEDPELNEIIKKYFITSDKKNNLIKGKLFYFFDEIKKIKENTSDLEMKSLIWLFLVSYIYTFSLVD